MQREETLIHALQPQLISLYKKILGKYIKPSDLANSIQSSTLFSIDYKNASIQVADEDLLIGYITRQKIKKLLEEGDISDSKYSLLFKSACEYFIRATEYLLTWFPLQDEFLMNATWIDFDHKLEKKISSVHFFVYKYPLLLSNINMDLLCEQFLSYQVLTRDDIPNDLHATLGLSEDSYVNVDALWGYLGQLKKPGSNEKEYSQLFRVAEVVLTVPH